MAGRPWTAPERDALRRGIGREPAPAIARELGRSAGAVYQQAYALGLRKRGRTTVDGVFFDRLRGLHADGLSDPDIAAALGCERHTVSGARKRLGLASNGRGDRFRAKIRAGVRRQCERAGVRNVGEVRSLAFSRRAAARGWPADLRPRAVEILELLADRGPMTRREIADALGMAWLGSRHSLRSNDPEGSYLAHLAARGLVVRLGRLVKGPGKGASVNLYSLAIDAERERGAG